MTDQAANTSALVRGYIGHINMLIDYKRILITSAALSFIFFRFYSDLLHPQFWAEDNILWIQAHLQGIKSLTSPLAGYLIIVPRLVALFIDFFDEFYAPQGLLYAGVVLDLIVVYIVTSPRLDIPFKPLLALAVVTPFAGNYALGTLVNSQWVLPIALFAFLFMRPGGLFHSCVETGLAQLISLTGPYSIILLPVSLWRCFIVRREQTALRRMLTLTCAMIVGASMQIAVIVIHRDDAVYPARLFGSIDAWLNVCRTKF